jgi:predicted Rossmann fold nucleotide-binding protein DprA/Smf involved in DNA uptake
MTKPPDIPKLLAERSKLLAHIATIDAALLAGGVRAVERVVGRTRDVSLDVLALVAKGVSAPKTIAEKTGQTPHAVSQMLHLLARAGEIHRVGRGVYKVGAA